MSTITPVDAAVENARALVARLGKLLFERHLTDAAGGNISVRVGGVLCMSPSYAGARHLWALTPDQVLVVRLDDGLILQGDGKLTREAKVHLRLHRDFGAHGTGVIHAHPRHLLVFAAANQPMPAVLEATLKFGTTPITPYAPAHTADLAEHVAATMRGRERMIAKHAAATLAAWHGVFVMGRDLLATFDAVERLDNNAFVLLHAATLGASPMLERERAALDAACAPYAEDEA